MNEEHCPPQPPLNRSSMVPHPWAGNPVLRVVKRLLGYRALRPWEPCELKW